VRLDESPELLAVTSKPDRSGLPQSQATPLTIVNTRSGRAPPRPFLSWTQR